MATVRLIQIQHHDDDDDNEDTLLQQKPHRNCLGNIVILLGFSFPHDGASIFCVQLNKQKAKWVFLYIYFLSPLPTLPAIYDFSFGKQLVRKNGVHSKKGSLSRALFLA